MTSRERRAAMQIRKYHVGEEEALFEIFYSSVRENAKKYYSDEQLKSWAPNSMELLKWKERISGINPYVVILDGVIVAYADLQDSGYIDHFFVKGGYAGRGIGKVLMTHLLEEAKKKGIRELTSDVSLAAQGFFSRYGFEVSKHKEVVIRGTVLKNALMCMKLDTLQEEDFR